MSSREVEYWQELCEIFEWSKTHVHSTFHICWGAQAGLYYHFGIKKHLLPKKLFGVFRTRWTTKTRYFSRVDDVFYVPHSRNSTVDLADVESCHELKVLATSKQAGVFACMTNEGKQIFITGHAEYDPDTLAREYFRDKTKDWDISVPRTTSRTTTRQSLRLSHGGRTQFCCIQTG